MNVKIRGLYSLISAATTLPHKPIFSIKANIIIMDDSAKWRNLVIFLYSKIASM